jgi:hypothetical protein
MPWLGVVLLGERFVTLNVDQLARFESVILKETLANKELLKKIEDKTKNIVGSTNK